MTIAVVSAPDDIIAPTSLAFRPAVLPCWLAMACPASAEAAALANELGSAKQALHLEREASRNQAKKVEQLQAVEARAAMLEAQLDDSRTRLAEAGETAARADSASDELWRQISALEVELSAAKSAIALEERLAKLDKAVFGGVPTSRLNAQSGSE